MKKYFKEYDYDRWTWLRIFPQYSQMEEEYGEMTKQLDDDNQQIAKLKKRQEILIKNNKKLKEKIENLEEEANNLRTRVDKYEEKGKKLKLRDSLGKEEDLKKSKGIKESKGVKDGKKGNRRNR